MAPTLPPGGERAPSVDPLADRREVAGPVTITEGMSLREIREAKRARLSDDFKSSEASRQAREYRQGAQAAPQPGEAAAPAGESTAGDSAAGDPLSAESAPAPASAARSAAQPAAQPAQQATPAGVTHAEAAAPVAPAQDGRTLRDGLAATRTSGFIGRLGKVFAGRGQLDASMIEQLEEVLFTADIGTSTSQHLLEVVQTSAREAGGDVQAAWSSLRAEVAQLLEANAGRLEIDRSRRPFVVLVVGVNGVGKTTTIGKLAARYQAEGLRVLVVAGDTFRAAAVQQLQEWSARVSCGFHAGEPDADPSSVIFEGIRHAEAEGYDVVLCDTAGRLHTRTPLVDELRKIARVAGKACDGAPHETVLVVDANTGQNAIQQARTFNEAVPLTGVVLTKLDGTAKGGVVLGISRELKVPVYFVGIGEGVRDLRVFDTQEFVDALF